MSTELVLVLSDILIPLKSPSIDSQFKSILLPNKINHLLCLGNIGNQDTLYWLQSLSPDVHIIKGDYDIYQNYPEKKVIQIGSFRLGMIHGHQILPPGNMDALSGIQSELDCDILLSGFTYKYGINIKENKLFMNPGSITGGLSPLMEDTYPSFILMAITDDEMTIYSYMLTDKNEKFQVGQMEYKKGSNEIKVVQEIKLEEDEEENKEDINNNNKENNENNINNEEKKNLEEKPKEEENNNINNINNEEENNKNEVILDNKPQIQNNENQEVKEEENQDIKENEIKDDKIDE